jgi:hypothetical protein
VRLSWNSGITTGRKNRYQIKYCSTLSIGVSVIFLSVTYDTHLRGANLVERHKDDSLDEPRKRDRRRRRWQQQPRPNSQRKLRHKRRKRMPYHSIHDSRQFSEKPIAQRFAEHLQVDRVEVGGKVVSVIHSGGVIEKGMFKEWISPSKERSAERSAGWKGRT